jgi:hypothetical protein
MLKGPNDLARISSGLIEEFVITIQNVKKQMTYIHKIPHMYQLGVNPLYN